MTGWGASGSLVCNNRCITQGRGMASLTRVLRAEDENSSICCASEGFIRRCSKKQHNVRMNTFENVATYGFHIYLQMAAGSHLLIDVAVCQ